MTFEVLTLRPVHAKVLPWTICLPILVLIAQTVFILERGQTDKQTDLTERPTPAGVGDVSTAVTVLLNLKASL